MAVRDASLPGTPGDPKADAGLEAALRAAGEDLAGAVIDAQRLGEPGFVFVADSLRRRRAFDDLVEVSSHPAWQRMLGRSAALARIHAQALIEVGRLDEAQQWVDKVRQRNDAPAEVLEAQGLAGRIAKQRYVDPIQAGRSGDRAALIEAIDAYLAGYDHPSRPTWQGVNAVALLGRAERDRIFHPRVGDRLAIARQVFDAAVDRSREAPDDFWAVVTAAEAALALGSVDEAVDWTTRFAEHPGTEAFALTSTLRQWRGVWGLLRSAPPGDRLLAPLERALLAHGTALLPPSWVGEVSADKSPMTLEKVFGGGGFVSLQQLRLAIERAKAVARMETASGSGVGTGWVVPGDVLKAEWGTRWVVVTNAHVVAEDGRSPLHPKNAKVALHALRDDGDRPFVSGCAELLAFSPSSRMDYAILRLAKDPEGIEPYPVAPVLPVVDESTRCFIIGHPKGGGLMFSLQDNQLLAIADPPDFRVHYRTPTEPGSSGSPVFNHDWELIALHHAGSASLRRISGDGTYEANEGVSIREIVAAL